MKAFVDRYRNSPTIFAWELANEPRCSADNIRNLNASAECGPELLTAWTKEMSEYVKSIDPNHLVTWGGEGDFNRDSDDWAYNGTNGGDFDAEIALGSIDFGVFHSYPDWWSKTVSWTDQWIKDHASSGRAVGKPVVHEEYGQSRVSSETRHALIRLQAGSRPKPGSKTALIRSLRAVFRSLVNGSRFL